MTEDLRAIAITWKHTADAEHPYAAELRGRSYAIRINDFPAEPLYTLLCDGAELLDLDDWPPAWTMPAPPKELLDTIGRIARPAEPRCEGAVRLAATSDRDAPVDALALAGDEIVAGPARRLDRTTLRERPSKPLERPVHPRIVLEGGDQERLLALAPEQGLAVSALATELGHEVRLHHLRSGTRSALAVAQPPTLAAAISANGKTVLVLDESGRVLCYDVWSRACPSSARIPTPAPGKRASVALARDGRLWLAAAGSSIELRKMTDEDALATVDLTPLGDDAASVLFAPDASGFFVGTARGVVMRFELLLDRGFGTREARIAAIADAVDAAIARTRWSRCAPRVEVYDERTEGGRTTLYFVADHYEYHQAQSGSDWAEHVLCAGHATFEGDRRVEAHVATIDPRRLTEREAEGYDDRAALAAFRAETARARSSATVVPGADAIKRAFDAHFARDGVTFAEGSLHRDRGKFSENGWDIHYRFGKEHGMVYADVLTEHRLTNDRLYRVWADGRVELVGSSTEGVLEDADRTFHAEVDRRFT